MISINLFALRALIYRLAGDWDACAARCIAFLVWAASPSVIISFIFCPRAWLYRLPARMGRLPSVGLTYLLLFSALRVGTIRLADDWDACAARSKVGPVMGLRPLRGPPCIPPEAPPKRVFNSHLVTRATRLSLRELPSLTPLAQAISLRAA